MILGRAVPVYGLIGSRAYVWQWHMPYFLAGNSGWTEMIRHTYSFSVRWGAAAGAKILYLLVSTGDIISDIQSDEMSL